MDYVLVYDMQTLPPPLLKKNRFFWSKINFPIFLILAFDICLNHLAEKNKTIVSKEAQCSEKDLLFHEFPFCDF